MKRLALIFIPSFILALIIFFSMQIFNSLNFQRGALQVTSSPESKVYLDDKYIGQTPLCKCEATDMLPVGDYTIRLVPVDKSLIEFQEKISISKEILTVVDRKFGKDAMSEGSVISLSPLRDKKKMELLVVSFPKGSTVYLDSYKIGETPLLYKNVTQSDHVLKVKKNGYKEKTLRIRIQMGYKLEVATYLGTSVETSKTAIPTPAPSDALSPTPSIPTVLILDTPTGFLRVRETSSAGSSEVARINPGESYELVDEKSGWLQIRMKDGKEGWISAQYAKKQGDYKLTPTP